MSAPCRTPRNNSSSGNTVCSGITTNAANSAVRGAPALIEEELAQGGMATATAMMSTTATTTTRPTGSAAQLREGDAQVVPLQSRRAARPRPAAAPSSG